VIAIALVGAGLYFLARGSLGMATILLVVGTGLGGSTASLPPWAKVAFFLILLLTAFLVLLLAL
jgi:hypothetical protein